MILYIVIAQKEGGHLGKGGKKKGKLVFSLVGLAAGLGAFSLGWISGATALQSAMYGMSLASTLWSVTNKQNPYGNLDSDYSQDDYSRFNTVTNDVNQNACIPVIYGTRKYGGLQTWHNPYNGNRYLQKDVVICEAGIEGIYNVMANEELIKNDTNISIYNIQYKDANVKRNGNTLILTAGGNVQEYKLGNTDNYNAQTSLLSTVIEKIRSDAGRGWKIDGAVDDRTSKGISADSMQFNSAASVKCYCDPADPTRPNMVVLDNRGYRIGTYTFHQNETPNNYMDVGGYPHLAWIRSNLVASSRLSGSNPTINAIIRGMKVKVFKNNQWQREYSENPAWIIRDFLTSTRYGVGAYITEDMLDDTSFKEVANYCDETIKYIDENGEIKTTPRYKLNIILDSQKTPIDHLSSMLAVFGGFITFGNKIALKIEKAETPVYDFDDTTIVKDSMSIGQTSLDDTPNRYKIGYFDPNQLWTEVKVVVEDLELQEEQEGKITEKTVSLAGCTSQNQALRIGRLYRDLNKVCSITISFSVATQGMMLECGDVINVTYGGIFTKMPFRITQIEETNTGIYQLTCRQYNASIYNDDLGAQITVPNYSNTNSPYGTNSDIPTITNLQLREQTWASPDGSLNINVKATWNDIDYVYFDNYEVLISTDNQEFNVYNNIFANNIILRGLEARKYYIGVRVVTDDGIKGAMVVGSIEVTGIDQPPPDVKIIDTDTLFETTRRFYWDFDYPDPNDIAGFRIKYNQGTNITWENAQPLHSGVITQQPFETKALRQGIHTVLIKAVDNAGSESKNAAYTVLNLGDPLEDNVLYHYGLKENNWNKVVHNGVIDSKGQITAKSNIDFWTSKGTPFWVSKSTPFWLERYSAFECVFQARALATGQFWLRYEIAGAATIQYRVVGKAPFWTSPNNTFWSAYNEPFWTDNLTMYKPYTGKVLINAGDLIQIRITSPENISTMSIIKDLEILIDVPDREEHFENIYVPIEGVLLPIHTPNYYTTAVRIDSVRDTGLNIFQTLILQKNPCKIRLLDTSGNAVAGIVDVTWQGFIKEVIK